MFVDLSGVCAIAGLGGTLSLSLPRSLSPCRVGCGEERRFQKGSRPVRAGQEFVTFQVGEAKACTRQSGDSDALRITDQVLIFSRVCREDGRAVVEPGVQVPPFPAAQSLRGRVELAGGIGDVVMRKRGNRGRDPGPIGLISGDTRPLVRHPSVLIRYPSVLRGANAK